MKVLYISGPYSNYMPPGYDKYHGRWQNVLDASRVALEATKKGWVVICPHKNTEGFFEIPWETMIEMDCELVRRSDAIIMIGKWQLSPGAMRELECAKENGKTVYYYNRDVDVIPSP